MHVLSALRTVILHCSSLSLAFFQRLHFTLIKYFLFPARNELPPDLLSWKKLEYVDDGEASSYITNWTKLEPVFEHYGFTLWRRMNELNQFTDGPPSPSSYLFVPHNFQFVLANLSRFPVGNGCLHAARKDDRYYVVRVISVGGQGQNNLHILRLLSSTSPDNLLSNNHILPIVKEIVYEDIHFAVFPKVGPRIQVAMMPLVQKNTIEDIVHILMQALEAVVYIHSKGVAHCDLFMDNFLLEWSPQSLLGQNWTRPRVYLIDFETAVHFSTDVCPADRLISGLPFPDATYQRKRAPELLSGEPYCPFRLDMWQFGFHLMQMFSTTGIAEIDTLWPPLMSENPADRPTAQEIFQALGNFISTVPPQCLRKGYECDPIII